MVVVALQFVIPFEVAQRISNRESDVIRAVGLFCVLLLDGSGEANATFFLL